MQTFLTVGYSVPFKYPSHFYLFHQYQDIFRVEVDSWRGEQTVGLSGGHCRDLLRDGCSQVCCLYKLSKELTSAKLSVKVS